MRYFGFLAIFTKLLAFNIGLSLFWGLTKLCFYAQLGRVVYERRQADGDKTYDSISLDWSYGYHRGYMLNHIAVQNHTPLEGEMELQVGDKILIHVRKTTLNQGYGLNLRTNIFGFYPAKKVRELVKDAFSPDSMIP